VQGKGARDDREKRTPKGDELESDHRGREINSPRGIVNSTGAFCWRDHTRVWHGRKRLKVKEVNSTEDGNKLTKKTNYPMPGVWVVYHPTPLTRYQLARPRKLGVICGTLCRGRKR